MGPRQCLLAVCLLYFSVLTTADYNLPSCGCIEDQKNRYFGYFLCRSLNITSLVISKFREGQCVNVSVASLEQNKFTDYPELLKESRFRTIKLQRNKLMFLPRFNQLSRKVKSLDVSWNKIYNSSDELRNMPSLSILRVSDNNLRSLQFLPDPCNIEELDVSGNALTAIDSSLRQCHALAKLNMARNNIFSLSREAFAGLRYLETLILGQNPLIQADGAFIGLSYLRRLSLKNTLFADIKRTMFTGMLRLEYLDLSGNRLSELSSDAFREAPNLYTLILDDNYISELPDHIFSNHIHLMNLSLRRNSFMSFPMSIILEDRNNSMMVDLRENSIYSIAMLWVARMDDIHKHVDEADNKCGYVSRLNTLVYFCINLQCRRERPITCADWLTVVNTLLGVADPESQEANDAV